MSTTTPSPTEPPSETAPLPRASLLQLPLELLSHILDFVNLQDMSYEDRVINSEIELCRDIAKLAEMATERRYDRGVAALYRTCRVFKDLAKGMMFERIFLSQTLSPYFEEHIVPTYNDCIQAVVLDDHKSWTEPFDQKVMEACVKKFYHDIQTKLPNFCRLRFSSIHCEHHFLFLCTEIALLDRQTRSRSNLDHTSFDHVRDGVHTLKFPVGFSRFFDKRLATTLFPHAKNVTIATLIPSPAEEALAALEELTDLCLSYEGIYMSPRLKWKAPLTSLTISLIDHDPATSNNWGFISQFAETLEQLQLSSHFQIRTPPTSSATWIVTTPFTKLVDLRLRMSSQLGLELLRLFSASPLQSIDLDLDEAIPLSLSPLHSDKDLFPLERVLKPYSKSLQSLRINRQEEPFATSSPLSQHISTFLSSINAKYLPNRYCDHPTFYKPHSSLTEEELREVGERGDVIVREGECVEGVREVLKFVGDWLDRSVVMRDQGAIVEVCSLLKPLATRMLTERD